MPPIPASGTPIPPGRLFGTDGVRGVYGQDLTDDLARALGRAGATVLSRRRAGALRVVIGRDTRASGAALEDALIEGAVSAGAEVLRVGIEPTPAIAYLAREAGAGAAVVVSASHNPPRYNGIKFFGASGMKLDDAVEARIEAEVAGGAEAAPVSGGSVRDLPDAGSAYANHVASCALDRLDGMRVVVDCANGSASHLAEGLLRGLGAEVVAIADRPDGGNINVGCGALFPEVVADEVVRRGADAGVALDGDADRALLVDRSGAVIDGDQILAACATAARSAGSLPGDVVVTTVMANLGFHRAMTQAGIRVVEAPVGDRYVLESMLATGAVLGGEQSGHIIFRELSPTGDGLLTAVRFLSLARSQGRDVAALAATMTRLPQVLVNVEVRDRGSLAEAERVWAAVRAVEAELDVRGRVLVRASGTEDLVRVMVEADDADEACRHAEALASVVRDELG